MYGIILLRTKPTIQRHSVEVSTAGSYLHIKPSTLETLARSAANANANRHRSKGKPGQQQENMVIREEGRGNIIREEVASRGPETSSTSFHTVTVLPPALKCLVFLWEELTASCMQVNFCNISIEHGNYQNYSIFFSL